MHYPALVSLVTVIAPTRQSVSYTAPCTCTAALLQVDVESLLRASVLRAAPTAIPPAGGGGGGGGGLVRGDLAKLSNKDLARPPSLAGKDSSLLAKAVV